MNSRDATDYAARPDELGDAPQPPACVVENCADQPQAWAFCWQSLLEVSRTFSRPIELLPTLLRAAVTCGYLLCRVADTVEDDPSLDAQMREALFRALLDTLENDVSPSTFMKLADALNGRDAEVKLAKNLDLVLAVFHSLPAEIQSECTTWIGEMIRGMSIFARRRAGANGLVVLRNQSDLERYCYFVAGCVGEMLSGLFLAQMPDLERERVAKMRLYAENFGLGLQLVNILKDQQEDLARGWCFIPQTIWETRDLKAGEFAQPTNFGRAHAAIEPIFAQTRRHLRDALEFTLAVPAEQVGVRLFCILPLWMAARTLRHAHRNDGMFRADLAVKISRDEVGELIARALRDVGDDAALRAQFSCLMNT